MSKDGVCFIRDLPVEEAESYMVETEELYRKNGFKLKCVAKPASSKKENCVDIWGHTA